MDIIVIVFLIVITILFFRRLSNVIYVICIMDIFLRLVSMIEELLHIKELSNIINKYLPNSIYSVINSKSSGIINTILVWIYIGVYVIFLCYIIKTFFKKKK